MTGGAPPPSRTLRAYRWAHRVLPEAITVLGWVITGLGALAAALAWFRLAPRESVSSLVYLTPALGLVIVVVGLILRQVLAWALAHLEVDAALRARRRPRAPEDR